MTRTKEANDRYKNPDNDKRGPWKPSDLSVKRVTEKDIYEITTPSGRKVLPPEGRSWVTSENNFKDLIKDNRIWFGETGNNVPSVKKFLSEVKDGTTPTTIWDYKEVGHNQDAKKETNKVLNDIKFDTPKPEKLLQRIIHIASNENDIVLDFFAGSGTTGAVAHKMNRRYIVTEQMDYVNSVTVERVKKVIEGEQGGISENVNWQGGGSFIYGELMEYNQYFIDKIQEAKTKDDILNIWSEMQDKAFISYQFDKDIFNKSLEAFKTASLETMQHYLIEVLDKNQLYVNFSEIEDKAFHVSEEDRGLNYSFYNIK